MTARFNSFYNFYKHKLGDLDDQGFNLFWNAHYLECTQFFGNISNTLGSLISLGMENLLIYNHCNYMVNNQAINSLNKNEYADMPNFLMSIVDKGHEVKTFPIHERWLDVGRQSDFQLAQEEYQL